MPLQASDDSKGSGRRGPKLDAVGPSILNSTLSPRLDLPADHPAGDRQGIRRESCTAFEMSPTGHRPSHGSGLRPRQAFRRTLPLAVVDLLSLFAGLAMGLVVLAEVSSVPVNSLAHFGNNLVVDIPFPFVALVMLGVYGLYRHRYRRLRHGSFGDLGNLVHALAVGGIGTLGLSVLLHRATGSTEIRPAPLVLMAVCAVVTVPAGRALFWWLQTSGGRAGKGGGSRVLLVGSGMMVERIRNYFGDQPGIEVVGSVDDNPVLGSSSIGSIADLPRLCTELDIDRVLIGFSRTHPSETIERLRPLQGTVAISIVPRYFELLSCRSQVDEICGLPVIDVAPPQLSLSARFVKRTFDVGGAVIGLVVLSPLLAVLAVGIKLSSPGPLIFRQQRVGRDGRSFTIYKFRTMKPGAENERDDLAAFNDIDSPMFKMRQDPRTFALGRFLRRTSLDEVPQLFNVLRGDMALVGPRPFIVSESEYIDGWAARRFEVRPGLTGLWQISGRNHLSFDELRQLDYLYVASWSLWWDLRILWHTPGSVLKSHGAY